MNGNDCLEQLEDMCGEIHGRPMTPAETEAISKGNFYFDEHGSICVILDKP
jgi:hypothetical protein